MELESDEEARRLIPELETSVYRIVQEALTNARAHGRAGRAVVEVIERDGSLTVQVRDNGSGFDVTASFEGFGLVGMRERVELFGGQLAVESHDGKGTSIIATLPAQRVGTSAGLIDLALAPPRASG